MESAEPSAKAQQEGPTTEDHTHHALLSQKSIKKVASAGGNLDSHTEHSHQSRLLPKPVADMIKETKGALPLTGNNLANYRNFALQKQKEAE